MRFALAVLACCLLSACLDAWPSDPEGTLERIEQTQRLRAAWIDHPPYASGEGHPAGVDIRLMETFAASLGAQVDWVGLSPEDAFAGLEAYRLDAVVGGIEENTPWKHKFGSSLSYATIRYRLGWPPGGEPAPSLDNLQVAVPTGSPLAGELEKKDAVPVEHSRPFASGLPVAAAEWELDRHGYRWGEKLEEKKLIVAVPKGENGFLARLDDFLRGKRGAVRRWLREDGGA